MNASSGILITNTLNFYISWRKSVRRIFPIHPRTDSKLLLLICQCMNITKLLCTRLNGFMLNAKESEEENDLITVIIRVNV